jgi:hypothetical protein
VFVALGVGSIPWRQRLEELEYRSAPLVFRVPFNQSSRWARAARLIMAVIRPTVMILAGVAMLAIGLGLISGAK